MVCQTHRTVPHVAKKTPRSQTETGPPEPFAEPAEAPASEVPEGTAGQDGDGDLGGDAGEAAASSAAGHPPVDDGRADEPDAEEAAALAAAPTQTMEAAGIVDAANKVANTQNDLPASEDGELGSAVAEPIPQAKGKGGPVATAAVVPRRTSSRVQKQNAPEPDVPDGNTSAASTLARYLRADELDQDDDGKDDDEEDAPSDPVATGSGGSLSVLAEGAAAVPPVARVQKKDKHKSGVWGVFLPTGYPVAKERVAAMDHTDGEPWEVEVWNMLEEPGGGNDVANCQSVARYYEQKTRAIMAVPYMGKMKDDD